MGVRHRHVATQADTANASLLRPSDWNADHLGALACVRPEEFGAIGDGITDDTVAIQAALDSSAGIIPVVFSGGKTYLTNSVTLTFDYCQIIIEAGSTVKAAPDGGVENVIGIFYLGNAHGRIDNYGTIDGNKAAQTFAYAGNYSALIISFEAGCSNFTYDGHGTGVITNSAYGGILLFGGSNDSVLNNVRITNSGNSSWSYSGIWLQGSKRTNVNHLRVANSTMSGMRIIGDSSHAPGEGEALHIDDVIVDMRGLAISASAGDVEGIGINAAYEPVNAAFPGSTISNCTIFGPDTVNVGALIIEGIVIAGNGSVSPDVGYSQIAVTNCCVFGSVNARSFDYGFEIAANISARNLTVYNCDTGILFESGVGSIHGSLSNTRINGVQITSGTLDLDLIVTDCCSVSGSVLFMQTSAVFVNLKIIARYLTVNRTLAIAAVFSGILDVHDSYILNNMSGSNTLYVNFDTGTGGSVRGSRFIGKNTTGIAISALAGSSAVRIQDNYFNNYSKPWDTSAGANNLITANMVQTCTTPAGAVAGSDTVANNKSF